MCQYLPLVVFWLLLHLFWPFNFNFLFSFSRSYFSIPPPQMTLVVTELIVQNRQGRAQFSVADPYDSDPDPTFHFVADPDPDPYCFNEVMCVKWYFLLILT